MQYAQINKGKVHGVFEYDQLPEFAANIVMVPIDDRDPKPRTGWLYDSETDTFSEPPAPPEQEPETTITRFAFRQRFTFEERVAIRTAAESDKEVMVWLEDLQTASFIDLTRSEATEGAAMLESKGLIDPGRADEVLTEPVQPHERP